MLLNLAKSKVARRTYAYQKMQQRYLSEVEMPQLEKRKQEIAEKRNLYKPIRKSDLEAHQKLYDELFHKQEEEHRKAREQRTMGNPDYVEKAKQFKTIFTEEVIKKRLAERELLQDSNKPQKEKMEKRLAYAKLVKEEYIPEASEAKVLELKEKITRIKHPVRQPPPKKPRLTPREKDRILKRNKSERKSWTGDEKSEPKTERTGCKVSKAVDATSAPKVETGKVSRATEAGTNTQKQADVSKVCTKNSKKAASQAEAPAVPKIDYLAEVKKTIQKKEIPAEMKKSDYYETVVKNNELSPKQKFDKVKSQVEMLEGNARKKEATLVKGGVSDNLQVGGELSEMYINAIKAKLSLLDL